MCEIRHEKCSSHIVRRVRRLQSVALVVLWAHNLPSSNAFVFAPATAHTMNAIRPQLASSRRPIASSRRARFQLTAFLERGEGSCERDHAVNRCGPSVNQEGRSACTPVVARRRKVRSNGRVLGRLLRKMIKPKEEEEEFRNEFLTNALEQAVDSFDKPTARVLARLAGKLADNSAHKLSQIMSKFAFKVGNVQVPDSQAKIKHLAQIVSSDPVFL